MERSDNLIMDQNSGYRNVRTAIVLPTLCRSKHLEKCLNSLMKNPWAEYVDLYIGLDYPAKESHWPGYREILGLMERDFSMFRSFHLVKRTENFGAGKNVKDLFERVLADHEQFIYMEDDTEFSENYLEYMLKALDYFRDDPDVISVSGYSYPVEFRTENNCNIVSQNAIFNMWGAGFWRDKYEAVKKELIDELCLIRDFSYNLSHYKLSRYRRIDYINCVAGFDPHDEKVRQLCPMFANMTDISMGVYMEVSGKYQAMPVISKVRNNGFDGTGLFCQTVKPSRSGQVTSETYDYSRQPIDTQKDFTLRYDGGKSRAAVFQTLDRFVKPSTGMVIKANLKLTVHRIFGRKMLMKLRSVHNNFIGKNYFK